MIPALLLGSALAGPADQSLDRYLEAPELRAALAQRSPQLAPCGQGLDDGAWPLHLRVDGSGHLGSVGLERSADGPPPAGLGDCLARVLGELPLRPHDEEPVGVGGTVLVRHGVASLGPVIEVDEHRATLLFLHLPPDLPAQERAELLELLGLAGPEPGND